LCTLKAIVHSPSNEHHQNGTSVGVTLIQESPMSMQVEPVAVAVLTDPRSAHNAAPKLGCGSDTYLVLCPVDGINQSVIGFTFSITHGPPEAPACRKEKGARTDPTLLTTVARG